MQHQQQKQQLQHLMQQQQHSMMSYYPNNITTDHIQQYLDENKSLILKIVESQNSGKMSECAENQARLQRNLMYLAAIADSQPQPPSLQAQYAQGSVLQQGPLYTQHPQAQQMPPQSLMAARSSMLYNTQQQPYATIHQQESIRNQLSMNSGFQMLQGNTSNNNAHRYADFRHESGGSGGEGLLGSAASGSGDGQEGQHSGGSHSNDGK